MGETQTIFWPPGPLPFRNDSSISSSGGGFGRGGRFLLLDLRSGGLLVVPKQRATGLEVAFRTWHCDCRPRRGRGRRGRKGRNMAMWWLHVAIAVVGYARASRGGKSFDVMDMVDGVDG